MADPERCCKSCRFWHPTQARDPGDPTRVIQAEGREKATLGQCRRYAPIPGTPNVLGEWPKTNALDWCGDWDKAA